MGCDDRRTRGAAPNVATCNDVVAPAVGDYYMRGSSLFDRRTDGPNGSVGLPFPEEYGGMGGDYTALCVASRSSPGGFLRGDHWRPSARCHADIQFGSKSSKPNGCKRPGPMLGAFGLTEPGAGSDAGGTATTATLDGDEWVISGPRLYHELGLQITG